MGDLITVNIVSLEKNFLLWSFVSVPGFWDTYGEGFGGLVYCEIQGLFL
jgi:hypothetical protein